MTQYERIRVLFSGFLAGIFFNAAVNSLTQDLKGKDEYLRWASDNWIDWKYTVPLAFFLLFLCSRILWTEINKGDDENN